MDFNKFCNICFKKENIIKLREGENETILNILILLTLRPDVFNDHMIYLCTQCCSNIENIDKFREMCLINLINFRDLYNQYKRKLEMSDVPDTVMKLKTFIEMNIDRPSGAPLVDYEVTENLPKNTNTNGNITNKNAETHLDTFEITYIPVPHENETIKESLDEDGTDSDDKNEEYKTPSTSSNNDIITTSDPSCSKSGNDDNPHIFIKEEYNLPDRDPLEVDYSVESESDSETSEDSTENASGVTLNMSSSTSSDLGNFQIFIKDEHKLLNKEKLRNVTNSDDEQHESNTCDDDLTEVSQLKLHLLGHGSEKNGKHETMARKTSNHPRRGKVYVHGEGPYKCPVCEKIVSKIVSFKAHLRYHLRENSFKCVICQKTFSTSGDLTIHERIHSGERPFKCSECGKTFSSSGGLKKHERVHTGEKPYKCSMCEKAFRQISILNTHERIHTGSRPYQCSMCDMKFTSSSNMKRHELVHTGEKAFKCSVCNKPFARTSDLKVHERIHNEDKSLSCNLCNKTFPDKSSLHRHERIHKGALVFNCLECKKTFSTANNLKKHQQVHTGP